MSQNDTPFRISQDFEIYPPKKLKSYPISVKEWGYIKEKIGQVSDRANIYNTIGSILLGASGSSLITALTSDFRNKYEEAIAVSKISVEQLSLIEKTPPGQIICWALFIITLISGLLAFFFGKEQRKLQNTQAIDVIKYMELIEVRYGVVDDQSSNEVTSEASPP